MASAIFCKEAHKADQHQRYNDGPEENLCANTKIVVAEQEPASQKRSSEQIDHNGAWQPHTHFSRRFSLPFDEDRNRDTNHDDTQ